MQVTKLVSLRSATRLRTAPVCLLRAPARSQLLHTEFVAALRATVGSGSWQQLEVY